MNVYIEVCNNSDGSSAQQCAHEPRKLNQEETRVYTCPRGMYGRYVRIRCPPDQYSYMQLCEVQIQPEVSKITSKEIQPCRMRFVISFAFLSHPRHRMSKRVGYAWIGYGNSGMPLAVSRRRTFLFLYVSGCHIPEELENAVKTVFNTSYRFGTNVTYTCDECYTGGGISTCQANDAQWSSVPKCTGKCVL